MSQSDINRIQAGSSQATEIYSPAKVHAVFSSQTVNVCTYPGTYIVSSMSPQEDFLS